MKLLGLRWVFSRGKRVTAVAAVSAGALALGLTTPAITANAAVVPHGWGGGPAINCGNNVTLCTEVADSNQAFGHYVGHDEPSVLFYSNQAGSGNQMEYSGVIPKEPPPSNVPGQKSYDFNLYAAFWYGMAMCATQSYPETVKECTPDSNTNITKAGSPYHAGTAYMELQFYPPGYVKQWNGFSCSSTKWCVALNIDSYAEDPYTGTQLNASCQSKVGIEYVNFAYLTHTGVPQGPPNPVQFSPIASGTPDPHKVFFLNQGDRYTVILHDTQQGLETIVTDTTTGQSGYMTASAANGFGQVKYAPNGDSCQLMPYNFHPEYSTSTPQTTVPWAAATYNIAFDTEVGHFDYCSKVDTSNGVCVGKEGAGANKEPADSDDYGCWAPSMSSLIKVGGCEASNVGYDGTSYLRDWPNGNSMTRPTPTLFSSPLTGPAYDTNYSNVAFNTDLPAIEGDLGFCNRSTGAGCSRYPQTDDNGAPATFYPYYTMGMVGSKCYWAAGQDVPHFTTRDFGQNNQYGPLQKVTYAGYQGTTVKRYEDFNGALGGNPCPAPLPRP
jgi:hypothetical protein